MKNLKIFFITLVITIASSFYLQAKFYADLTVICPPEVDFNIFITTIWSDNGTPSDKADDEIVATDTVLRPKYLLKETEESEEFQELQQSAQSILNTIFTVKALNHLKTEKQMTAFLLAHDKYPALGPIALEMKSLE